MRLTLNIPNEKTPVAVILRFIQQHIKFFFLTRSVTKCISAALHRCWCTERFSKSTVNLATGGKKKEKETTSVLEGYEMMHSGKTHNLNAPVYTSSHSSHCLSIGFILLPFLILSQMDCPRSEYG